MWVLVAGATGYLGGAVALRLRREGHNVVALARDVAKADPLTRAGLVVRAGSLDDAAELKRAVSGVDAVINAADSDHAGGVNAILDAVAGTAKTFIHTSGISVTGDRAAGAAGEAIRDEYTPYEPIPERAARYAVDAAVRAAAARGCRPMVICCPLVYGPPAWPGRESVQLPHLVRDARERGVACFVGAGAARWSHCHIDDIAEAYALALATGQPGGLYYPESGEQSWSGLSARIGSVLNVPAASWTLDAAIAAWGQRALWTYSSNARTRGVRIRKELGWTPRIDDVDGDIRRLAAQLD
jgi:nucleoside-diphosphate-sugar epimerase